MRGIGFVRGRVAEVDLHAVADVARDVSSIALDGTAHVLAVSPQQLTQFFGIDPARHLRVADEIAEHHRDLATIGDRTGRRRAFPRHGPRGWLRSRGLGVRRRGRLSQRSCALAAELEGRWILESATGTEILERRAALTAELH